MPRITIADLEVYYRVGATEQERAEPQRLLLGIEMELDFSAASASDSLENTINYQAVADELLKFGEGRNWKLLERLAGNVADMILAKYQPDSVRVEVKKFVIPQARYVGVSLTRAQK